MSQLNVGKVIAATSIQFPTYTTANLPANQSEGAVVYDSDVKSLKYWSGSLWLKVGQANQDGSSAATAATSVAQLQLAGQTADGFYYLNFGNGAERLYVPLSSDPGYVAIASWGGGLNAFFGAGISGGGTLLNQDGASTPTGNFALDNTYGYYRNTGTEGDIKHATISNRNIAWRYAKFRFHLYNYYSNDGFTASRNLSGLGINGNVGDGLTILRNNAADGDTQHIFTYLMSINQGGYYCSNGGTAPTMSTNGVTPPAFVGSRFTCMHRSASGYDAEYIRNFTPISGDSNGSGNLPSVYAGDSWFTVDTGSTRTHGLHVAIHSDQATANEDTYMRRGVIMVKA